MDVHTLADIVSVLAGLAAILVVITHKTLPDLVKKYMIGRRFDRFIIGLLVLIGAGIWWVILPFSSPDAHIYLSDVIVIGLFASAVGLLLSRTALWSLAIEVILGLVGAACGKWLVDTFIPSPNFSASLSIVFASALALIALFRLFEYFFAKGDIGRLTVGVLLFIIVAAAGWGIYSSPSLNTSLEWYHLLLIGFVVSAFSLVIPKPYFFSILLETAIGPLGGFGGYYLLNVFVHSPTFHGKVGIQNVLPILLIAFALMSVLRLVYLQFFSTNKRSSTGTVV